MASSVKVGDKVTTTAVYDWNGTHLASFVRTTTYDVIQVGGKNLSPNRIVIGLGSAVTAAVDISTLTVVGTTTATATPEVTTTKTEAESTPDPVDTSAILSSLTGGLSSLTVSGGGGSIDGAKVQYLSERYTASDAGDYNYSVNGQSDNSKIDAATTARLQLIERQDPSIVQNALSFPKNKGYDSSAKMYRYSYYQDYDSDTLSSGKAVSADMEELWKSMNQDVRSRSALIQKYTSAYNRFKMDNPNDRLAKTFSHVFFVRPDCNIYAEGSSGNQTSPELADYLKNESEFYYALKHSPELLRQLTQSQAGYDHEFMMFLSNKARSFEIKDEYITDDKYGIGLTGYSIPYGKDNVESRASERFSINYRDDRDLHVYHLHKLWMEYISLCFRGKILPKESYNKNKVLDYPTCLYYILCAEDGESVIFWTKYWGVFPVEAPSSGFSYSADNAASVNDPELRIEYRYAWKEDFNPLTLIEFNKHSAAGSYKYLNRYNSAKAGSGYAWAGAPFVETWNRLDVDLPYTFKLKFRPT
jgi:hypothetical protein